MLIGGRYALERVIGRGGMGSVWLGRDDVLGRQVAVKRVGTQPGMSSPDLVRAEREARNAARISHPHVVAVFDLVDHDDQQWLVMEYVDGSTLAELIRGSGPLEHQEAARLLAQAADALAAAHRAGVVHRDVKPSNILVTAAGEVKLSDFGIAQADKDPSLTATGLVTGSPAYICPEVASGRPASGASDVWSLGATAFHALSGTPPYDVGDNVLGALYRIVHEDPPRLDGAGWLGDLVASCMQHDPAARPSMAEVAERLRAGTDLDAAPPAAPATAFLPPVTTTRSAPAAPVVPPPAPVSPPAQDDGLALVSATAAPASSHAAPRRGGALPFVVGGVMIVLAVMVALLLLLPGGDDAEQADAPAATPSSGAPADPTPSETAPSDPAPSDEPVTAEQLEEFVAGYLPLAASSPGQAFGQLSAPYQDASGGIAGYRGFWDRVSNVQLGSIEADPENFTVTYEYSYDLDGSPRTDRVRMTLLEDGAGGFLIAGADTL